MPQQSWRLADGPALRIISEVKKEVVGKDREIVKTLLAILSKGHVLLEDIPGVGKTTMALAFSRVLGLEYKRMQCNPDVTPSDIVGFSVYDRQRDQLEYKPGAVICNLFLADEINRASSRSQAALLEAMEEGAVTVDGQTHPIPKPFIVIATQNPTGSSGTQLLPDSQLDRFMVRFSLGYPAPQEELELLRRKHGAAAGLRAEQAADGPAILQMQREIEQVYLSDELYDYIIRLVGATRNHPLIAQGGSPRAAIAVTRLAQALAWVQGRDYAVPQDAAQLFQDAVGHRLILSPRARAEGVAAASLLEDVLRQTPQPRLRA